MPYSVGDITIDRINELDSWPFPPKDMFPAVTAELYAGDALDFAISTYLVRTPDQTLLVDAGNGNDKHRPVLTAHDGFSTDYLDRLRAVVDPGDIDIVVCTHLHPDHCGGLTRLVDDRWVPTFPNARHLVPRQELDWLQDLNESGAVEGPVADLIRTYDDSVLPVLNAGLVELIDVPIVLGDGITVRSAAGHTPGHVVVEVQRDDEFAIISGDALHDPFQLGDLTLAHSGDADPVAAHHARQQLVDKLADTGGLLLPCHFAPGRIARQPNGYAWNPL